MILKYGKNKQKKEQKAQLGVFLCSSMIYYDALLPNPIATWLNVLFCLIWWKSKMLQMVMSFMHLSSSRS